MDKVIVDDSNRYIWLIAHMGKVEEYAKSWDPSKNKPLLAFLQDYIDGELRRESPLWVKKQRALLNSNWR